MSSQANILVVEDDDRVAALVSKALSGAGYTVKTESSGLGAIQRAAEWKPDLVVLDVMLPDINGLEVCAELRKETNSKTLPIIFLTAMSAPLDKFKGLAQGADAYFTKPFEVHELIETVEDLLKRHI